MAKKKAATKKKATRKKAVKKKSTKKKFTKKKITKKKFTKKKFTKKKSTKKKSTKKKASKKKAAVKKASKKAVKKPSGSSSALTAEQQKKVRKLLRSKDAGNVKLAISLLESTDATKEDWNNVFSPTVLRQLVNTWDLAILASLAKGLEMRPSLKHDLERVCKSRFSKLSNTKQKQFLEVLISTCDSQLTGMLAICLRDFRLPNEWQALIVKDANISDATARLLARAQCNVCSWITCLSDTTAESLSKHKGDLDLPGLTSLSDAAAESLSKHKGDLSLSSIECLSDSAAMSFSKYKGSLDLRGLTCLSDGSGHIALARKLISQDGYVSFDGLTSLSDAAAVSFARYKGPLELCGLTSLSDAVAESLSKHSGGMLVLNALTSLSDAAVESLSKHSGEELGLN